MCLRSFVAGGSFARFWFELQVRSINKLEDQFPENGVERAHRSGKLARLTALKQRYDPDNVFHLNHNIRP